MTTEELTAGMVTESTVARLCEGSPEWLAQRRRAAWDAYTALPMPSSHQDEDWRRTDLGKLDPATYGRPQQDDVVIAQLQFEATTADPDACIVTVLPDAIHADIPDRLAAQGVIVCSWAEAAARHGDLFRDGLGVMAAGESKFLALWSAIAEQGVFIHVPAGVNAASTVWVLHPGGGDNALITPATVAMIGDHASLTLVETYASAAGSTPMLSTAVSALRVGRGAQLDHAVVQRWGEGVTHIATHRAELHADATLRSFVATLGSRLQKTYWDALLIGRGARAEMYGVAFGDAQQHLDHQSLQAHRAPDTTSTLLLKTAVRDHATSVYSGLIDVDKDAVHTDGYVQNRNLILDHGAKANSIPRLEIKASDVKCGHGATAGHIDDEQRFYLQSRGIQREEADQLIVGGFLDEVMTQLRHEGLRAQLRELLDAEVAGSATLGVHRS